VPTVALSETIAAAEISFRRNVFAAVVLPEPTVPRKILNVVATPVVGAVATDKNLTFRRKLPFAPAVKTLKISVPTVPAPAELVFAAVVVIVTCPTFGVRPNTGVVFAATGIS
jgi:hypothetical protein